MNTCKKMRLDMRLFVLFAAAAAVADAGVSQKKPNRPAAAPTEVDPADATTYTQGEVYPEARNVQFQKKQVALSGRRGLRSALALLVTAASVSVLGYLLLKCFKETAALRSRGSTSRRLSDGLWGQEDLCSLSELSPLELVEKGTEMHGMSEGRSQAERRKHEEQEKKLQTAREAHEKLARALQTLSTAKKEAAEGTEVAVEEAEAGVQAARADLEVALAPLSEAISQSGLPEADEDYHTAVGQQLDNAEAALKELKEKRKKRDDAWEDVREAIRELEEEIALHAALEEDTLLGEKEQKLKDTEARIEDLKFSLETSLLVAAAVDEGELDSSDGTPSVQEVTEDEAQSELTGLPDDDLDTKAAELISDGIWGLEVQSEALKVRQDRLKTALLVLKGLKFAMRNVAELESKEETDVTELVQARAEVVASKIELQSVMSRVRGAEEPSESYALPSAETFEDFVGRIERELQALENRFRMQNSLQKHCHSAWRQANTQQILFHDLLLDVAKAEELEDGEDKEALLQSIQSSLDSTRTRLILALDVAQTMGQATSISEPLSPLVVPEGVEELWSYIETRSPREEAGRAAATSEESGASGKPAEDEDSQTGEKEPL